MAPFAVLHHFDTFGRILLVLVCTIIAALAFCACKSNSFTHSLHLTQSFSARGQLTCLISISQAQCTSQQIFANFAFKKAGPSQQNYCSTIYRALQMVFCERRQSERFSSLMRLSAQGFLGLTALWANAIALRRIQKVHVITMCAFFLSHFQPVNKKHNFFQKRLDKFKKICGLRPVRREIFNC